MKLYVLHSEVTNDLVYDLDGDESPQLCYLGVHSTPERAMAFAQRVADLEVEEHNRGFREEGEAELEVRLNWTAAEPEPGDPRRRWTSDTYEASCDAVKFEVQETGLDPTL